MHLTLHCSFIAHYDIHGFYHTYFKRPEKTADFLKQFDRDFGCLSVEYGGSWWLKNEEYNDINQAMCDAIEQFKSKIYEECKLKERNGDVLAAKALLSKHGINMQEVI